jgi:purine nucleosidase
VAIDPSLVRAVPGPVLVETRGEHTTGRTVVDLRPRRGPLPTSNTAVCLEVDEPRFRSVFLETLGLSARRAARSRS